MDTIQRLQGILTEAAESGPEAFVKKWQGKDPRFTKYESRALQMLLDGFADGKVKIGDVKGSIEGPGPTNFGADGAERTVRTTYRFDTGQGETVQAIFEWFGAGGDGDDDADSVGFEVMLTKGGKRVDGGGERVVFPSGKEPGAKFMSAFGKVYKKMALRFAVSWELVKKFGGETMGESAGDDAVKEWLVKWKQWWDEKKNQGLYLAPTLASYKKHKIKVVKSGVEHEGLNGGEDRAVVFTVEGVTGGWKVVTTVRITPPKDTYMRAEGDDKGAMWGNVYYRLTTPDGRTVNREEPIAATLVELGPDGLAKRGRPFAARLEDAMIYVSEDMISTTDQM